MERNFYYNVFKKTKISHGDLLNADPPDAHGSQKATPRTVTGLEQLAAEHSDYCP